MSEQPLPPLDKILPIGPGYVCISNDTSRNRNAAAARLAVIAVAERSEGVYQACVIGSEGRLEFSSGPVFPEGPTHDETSSSKALQEISLSLKQLLAVEQGKAKK